MKAIRIETLSGKAVFVAVSDDIEPVGGPAAGGHIAGREAPSQMVQRFEEVGAAIADVCNSVQQKVLGAIGDAKPTELTLAFGIKLAGTAAIPLVTSTSIEGTFQVTAKWDFAKK